MNYTKPEITSLASASLVIQGKTAKALGGQDSTSIVSQTPAAYEADE
jgi:hypothetical protein